MTEDKRGGTCATVTAALREGEPDRLCSMPVGHDGMHRDLNLGVAWPGVVVRQARPAHRFRAHYGQPAPVEFEATLPDDVDDPEDLRQFLLDEAPFSRQAAVRVEPVSQEGPFLPSPSAVDATNPGPEGGDTGGTGTGDLRASLVQALAADMDPDAFAPYDEPPDPWNRYGRQAVALEFAGRALAAGWRRVTEDPDEVERLAAGMRGLAVAERGVAADGSRLTPWERIGPNLRRWYLHEARLALAVLRGGAQPKQASDQGADESAGRSTSPQVSDAGQPARGGV